jgi:hypothetical protein
MLRRNIFSRSASATLDRPFQVPRFSAAPAALFGPAQIAGLAPIAWFRWGIGITVATGVSQWNDQSGHANHLKQAVAGSQPKLQPDNSILFDGVANVMGCAPFTFIQPEAIYLLFQQLGWTANHYILDGSVSNSGRVIQAPGSPSLMANAGSSLPSITDLQQNTYGVLVVVFNGASSSIQVNNGVPVTGNAGASNMGGFTLGASGGAGLPSNIQVKEAILFPAAHDAATRRSVIGYLGRVGGIVV